MRKSCAAWTSDRKHLFEARQGIDDPCSAPYDSCYWHSAYYSLWCHSSSSPGPAVGGWFCVLFSDPFDDVLTKNATRKRSGILLVWLRLRVSEGKNANFKERSAGPDDTILFLALQNFCVISIFYLWTFSSTFVRIFGLLFCFRVSAPRAPAKLAYSLRSLAFGSLICVRPEMTFGNVAAFMKATQ